MWQKNYISDSSMSLNGHVREFTNKVIAFANGSKFQGVKFK